MVAARTGLRASEIRALDWADVDFAAQIVRVRQRADTSGQIGSPKSAASRRDVPMTPGLITMLKEWRIASGGRTGLVFPGQEGRPLCHNTLRKTLGRCHAYRHFFASWLIDQGFGPKRIQALMGHSSITVTFDTYGHLFPQDDDAARFAAAEQALGS
jgi:integrase